MTRNKIITSLAVNSWINRGRVIWPGADLTEADLTGANLTGARLIGARLTGATIALGNRTFRLTQGTER